MPDPRPVIALTAGDPAGVGPELICRLAADGSLAGAVRTVVIGDLAALRAAAKLIGGIEVNPIDRPDQGRFEPGGIDLIACSDLGAEHCFGRTGARCGQSAHLAVCRAVELAASGAAEAICTAPLAKASLRAAGVPHPGHTELLTELTGAQEPATMLLAGPIIKVALVTTHLALSRVSAAIDPAAVRRAIDRTADFGLRLGYRPPRIGVCGLNPHAGEEGLFGDEDRLIIGPAVDRARADGLAVTGPEPADTLFHRAAEGEFDLVVAMYHDQGLAPIKLLHFHQTVNVTLGLPVIRTSVGHGTAFDLAGQNRADSASLRAALLLAAKLARPELNVEPWPS